jgi:hypothetical protein
MRALLKCSCLNSVLIQQRYGYRRPGPIFGLFLLTLLSTISMTGQTFTGAITGIVTDAAGAMVPGASVVITNTGTAETRQTVSDDVGRYSVQQLLPGTYSITVTANGFKRFVKDKIDLFGNQTAEINAGLVVGDTSQSVEVSASALSVDTQTANKDITLDSQQVISLPTSLRNPLFLVHTTAGVATVRTGLNPYQTDQNQNRFSLNGGRDESSAILVDGAPIVAPDWGGAIVTPSQDVVAEVQVKRAAFDAQFTRTDGGVVSVITKNGTDQFHGSAFEYLRNDAMDANSWGNNRAGVAKPPFKRHQFGGTLGGPVSKARKIYFYGGYEGVKLTNPRTFLATVPTAAERAGDFSQTLNADGTPSLIFNPFTTVADPSSPTGYRRQIFAGNKIPASLINPVGAKVAGLYALPNTASTSLADGNNYASSAPFPYTSKRMDTRGDWVMNEKNSLFARFTMAWQEEQLPTFFGNGADSFDGEKHRRFLAVLGDTWVPGPSWVINILLTSGRWEDHSNTSSNGFSGTTIGLPVSTVAQFQATNILPNFNLENYTQLGNPSLGFTPKETHNLQINASHEMGSHSLKFGWVAELQRLNPVNLNAPSFNFDRGLTSGPTASLDSTNSGNAIASLLLGTGSTGNVPYNAELALQQWSWGWYIQDSWRFNSRLTIGLGLRYEIQNARTERYNQLNYFATQATNPLSAATGLNLKGGLVYLNNDNRGLWDTDYKNFQPRLSLAYKITDKLVFRSGYGIFSPATFSVNGDATALSYGYSTNTPWNSTQGGGGFIPLNLISNPFPSGFVQPSGNSLGLLAGVGSNINAMQRLHPTPYTQTYTADVQYQITPSAVVELGYVGTQGRKLLLGNALNNSRGVPSLNQLPSQYLALGSALNNQVANPFQRAITTGPLSGATIPAWRLLVAYPQYTGVNLVGDTPGASSSFNALTVKYTQRMSKSVTALLTYQWSKAIDDTSETQSWEVQDAVRDVFNRRLDRSISAHDLTHDFVGSVIWELPVGRNRMFGSHMNRVAEAVLGGWQLSTIVRLGSGLPLQFWAPNALATYGYQVSRPNVTSLAALAVANPNPNQWFNTSSSVISAPGTYQIGNMPRFVPNIRTGPSRNADMTISKNFSLTEQVRLQLRGEAYNISNTPQYGRADTTVGSPTFGQVSGTTNLSSRSLQVAARVDF